MLNINECIYDLIFEYRESDRYARELLLQVKEHDVRFSCVQFESYGITELDIVWEDDEGDYPNLSSLNFRGNMQGLNFFMDSILYEVARNSYHWINDIRYTLIEIDSASVMDMLTRKWLYIDKDAKIDLKDNVYHITNLEWQIVNKDNTTNWLQDYLTKLEFMSHYIKILPETDMLEVLKSENMKIKDFDLSVLYHIDYCAGKNIDDLERYLNYFLRMYEGGLSLYVYGIDYESVFFEDFMTKCLRFTSSDIAKRVGLVILFQGNIPSKLLFQIEMHKEGLKNVFKSVSYLCS